MNSKWKSYQGIWAVVTGASQGLGEAFSRELAASGANLVLVARSGEKLQALAEELKNQCSIEVHTVVSDLSLSAAPWEIFSALKRLNVSVDLLINNAGFGWCGRFEDSQHQRNEQLMALNMNQLVSLTHLLMPAMLEKQKGGILNVASSAAYQPIPFMSLYAASKAFVLAFSEGLWAEYRSRGIRVFCLSPGNTITGFHECAGIEKKKVFLAARADRVVRFGLKKFLKTAKPSAVYGFWNNVLMQLNRISPRCLSAVMTGAIYRKNQSNRKGPG